MRKSSNQFFIYYKDDQLSLMTSNIEATNRKRASSRTVGSYAVLELLGSGAFGSVYKVSYVILGSS